MCTPPTSRLVLVLLAAPVARSQTVGHGISKTTYSCNDPIPAWTFLNKYFPVGTPSDECTDNICECPATTTSDEWYIQQGRVYALTDDASVEAGTPQGNGFGIHLVNVSEHLTTGGMSTAQVEAQFITKLAGMSTFDSFMDFNALFYTSELETYASTFDADGVPYYALSWASEDGTTYTSILLHVPSTQLVIELTSDSTLALKSGRRPVRAARTGERRASERALAMVAQLRSRAGASSDIITPLAVNRAVSANVMAALDEFYLDGMGTKKVTDDTDGDDYAKKCYLWTGATVDVCFYQRDDSETKGDWKVGNFSDMLNRVHSNIIVGYPLCGLDKCRIPPNLKLGPT